MRVYGTNDLIVILRLPLLIGQHVLKVQVVDSVEYVWQEGEISHVLVGGHDWQTQWAQIEGNGLPLGVAGGDHDAVEPAGDRVETDRRVEKTGDACRYMVRITQQTSLRDNDTHRTFSSVLFPDADPGESKLVLPFDPETSATPGYDVWPVLGVGNQEAVVVALGKETHLGVTVGLKDVQTD